MRSLCEVVEENRFAILQLRQSKIKNESCLNRHKLCIDLSHYSCPQMFHNPLKECGDLPSGFKPHFVSAKCNGFSKNR